MATITLIMQMKGFTLIELMIVIGIISILATIGYPRYQSSLERARRADAVAALAGLASAMERVYTESNSYCDAADSSSGVAVNNCGNSSIKDTGLPNRDVFTFQSSFYTVTIASVSSDSYSLTAVPAGSQINDSVCGTLTINQLGIKTNAGGLDNSECW